MELKRYPMKKHEDPRGFLVQNEYKNISEGMKHVLISFTKPGIIRGNHYHKRKREWFYVVKGTMKLHLLDLKTGERQEHIISSDHPEFFEMEPDIVHAMENIGDDEMIFMGLVNEVFDPNDPDTYSQKIA